jgi:hypothetical protein
LTLSSTRKHLPSVVNGHGISRLGRAIAPPASRDCE